jgi:glycosyltransferase involved in cell wall biosynthesis
VTVVSETDAGHIRKLEKGIPVHVIPNCLDVLELQEKLAAGGRIFGYDLVFSGKMDYRPNIDAVLWFADNIWPLIKEKRPKTTWAVVGQKPHARLDRVAELDGVKVTGWVEEVRPYLAGASVFIMPFRMGSGTRLKLIEAMAAGRAIVSTEIGAEGFPITDKKELLLADDPSKFAYSVLTLLSSNDMKRRLGIKAAEFARLYDWRVVVPRFDQVYAQLEKGNLQ